ncbi:MAG: hypothetical protein V4484_21945 [Pseudomonadota bacterium]
MNTASLTMLAVLASAIPHKANAQWRTEPAGCAVALGKGDPQAHVRWTGACVDGKVSGAGTLMASNGTMLDGEFREGKPWNVAGWTPIRFESGSEAIAAVSYTQGAATSFRRLSVPGGAVPTANTPMLGIWNWHANDGACLEVQEFGASGDARVSSGEVRLDMFFSLFSTAVPDHYWLLATRLASNGKPDCQQHIATIDKKQSSLMYVRFDADGSYRTCTSSEEVSCYGSARRSVLAAQ